MVVPGALAISIDWQLLYERIFTPGSTFWKALGTTISIAIISELVGIVLGFLTWLAARSRLRLVRGLAFTYMLAFRGTPLVVQVFFIYFGTNLFLGIDIFPREVTVLGLGIPGAVLAGVVGLSLNEGAYMSEVIRAGINAIDPGQMESALSVGMRRRVAMRRIVLPQAARVIIPPLGNQFNYMIKSTSLLAFIGVYEMFRDAQIVYSRNFQPVEVFLSVAFWYLILTTLWSLVQVQIERRFGASEVSEDEPWTQRILGIQAASRT
ncbi:MAG: amino acid ABC transporter permease [Aeromicrobium sp.]